VASFRVIDLWYASCISEINYYILLDTYQLVGGQPLGMH
jgi:hypothetical protein